MPAPEYRSSINAKLLLPPTLRTGAQCSLAPPSADKLAFVDSTNA